MSKITSNGLIRSGMWMLYTCTHTVSIWQQWASKGQSSCVNVRSRRTNEVARTFGDLAQWHMYWAMLPVPEPIF